MCHSGTQAGILDHDACMMWRTPRSGNCKRQRVQGRGGEIKTSLTMIRSFLTTRGRDKL